MARPETRRRFWRIATAGIFFQGGAAAVDTGTIVAALVHGLTGSPTAVGVAAAIARYGWLFPQLFVAYFAQGRRRRLPFYMLGAFGRVACLLGVALLVAVSGPVPGALAISLFFLLWALYAFVSGIVAVPYNDIVARAVPSAGRSRLLAVRFFGGGLLALGVAGLAHRLLGAMTFPGSHAAVLGLGALLLLVSALSFVSAGESEAPPSPQPSGFGRFLKEGISVYRADRRFRLFVYSRWLDGAAAMALPFYVIQAIAAGVGAAEVAMLLGAQTAGALASNPLWGWWGDRIGKRPLLEGVAALSVLAPGLALVWSAADVVAPALIWFACSSFSGRSATAAPSPSSATSWRSRLTTAGRPTAATSTLLSRRLRCPRSPALPSSEASGCRRCSWPAPLQVSCNFSPSAACVDSSSRRPGHDPPCGQ